MNLLPNQQQSEIVATVATFLQDQIPIRRYQNSDTQGKAYSKTLWQQLVQLGWFGLCASEANGGSGLGIAEAVLVTKESGKQLASPTVLATGMAAVIAEQAGSEALTKRLISGATRVALGLVNPIDKKVSLFDADKTDYVLLCSESWLQVFAANDFQQTQLQRCTDESLRFEISSSLPSVEPVLKTCESKHRLWYALLLAASLTGIAEAAMLSAAAYAKQREQFGRPIGSFQSINHLCADMAVTTEACSAQLIYAALSLAQNDSNADEMIAAIAVLAKRGAIENARHNVQIHGAVGFTTEYDAHFFVKRAHVYTQLLNACLPTTALLIPTVIT